MSTNTKTLLGGLSDAVSTTVEEFHGLSMNAIEKGKQKIESLATVLKETYPPVTGPVDFALGTVFYGTDITTALITSSFVKGREVVNVLSSSVTDLKDKKLMPIKEVVMQKSDHARESFEKGKGYLFGGIDILIVHASHIIIRAPEELRPHILSALEAAQPYISSAVSVSKPYFEQAVKTITPYAIQLRPYVQPYLINLANIIQKILDKSPALTGLIALAVVEAENAIENISVYVSPTNPASVSPSSDIKSSPASSNITETSVYPSVVLRTDKSSKPTTLPQTPKDLHKDVDVFGVEKLINHTEEDPEEVNHK